MPHDDQQDPGPARARGRAQVAVLAGGAARRLGGRKATVDLGGRPLISYPVAAAADAGLDVAVVAKPSSTLPELEVPVWTEPELPLHPLAGVALALKRAPGRRVVAIACDMPFVTAAFIAWLANSTEEAVVPRALGRLHPLAAAYGPAALAAIERAAAEGEAAVDAVERLGPRLVEAQELSAFGAVERLLLNVNTASDLARARALARA